MIRHRSPNHLSAFALFLLSSATILPLIPIPKVEAATTGNLVVTVYNVDRSLAYSLGGTTLVRLYDSTYTFLYSQTINSYSQVSWSNINSGTYYVEVYHTPNGGRNFEEFWGANQVTVPSGGTSSFTFTRHAPILYAITYSSSNIALGQSVTVSVTAKNLESTSLGIAPDLLLDRDQTSPYDFNPPSAFQTIPAGGTYTWTFTITPTQAGIYYRLVALETSYSTSLPFTDQTLWQSPLMVQGPPSVGLVSPQNGATVSSLPVTLQVQTTSNGSPVQGATVSFYLDSTLAGSSSSDSSGYAQFTVQASLVTGTHTWYVVASKPGNPAITSSTWTFTYSPIPSHTVTLTSSTTDGMSNVGTITFDGTTYSLPNSVSKQATSSYSYSATANPPAGYIFSSWSVSGGVQVTAYDLQMVGVRVQGAGTLNAVLASAPSFTISAPSSLTVAAGNSATIAITLVSQNQFSGSVNLGLVWNNGRPSWVTQDSFSPNPVSLSSGSTASSTLAVTIASSATPGTYSTTVVGTGGSVSTSVNIQINVQAPPPLSASLVSPSNGGAVSSLRVALQVQITSGGSPVLDATVSFYLDSTSAGSVSTDPSGYATDTVQASLMTGTHSWYVTVSKSGYSSTTSSTWTFTYATGGGLVVTVHNVDGTFAYALGGTTTVDLYDSNYHLLYAQNIDSNSQVPWSNLNPGTYNIEVYHSPGIGLNPQEFWGGNQVTVLSDGTNNFSYTRHAPILYGITYSSSSITLGQPVTVSITVKNLESASKTCYVRLVLDRDQASSYDHDVDTGGATIVAGGTYTWTLTYTPTQVGTYYRIAAVYTTYSTPTPTDQTPWQSPLMVQGPLSVGLVSPQNGATVSSLPVTLQVQTTSNGSPVQGATVSFYLDSRSASTATSDASGLSEILVNGPLKSGQHTWYVMISKSEYTSVTSFTWSFAYQIQNPLTAQIVSPTNGATVASLPITLSVQTLSNGAPVQGVSISFYLDSSRAGSAMSDSSGYASTIIQTSLIPGQHNWYVVVSGSGYQSATSSTWSFSFQPALAVTLSVPTNGGKLTSLPIILRAHITSNGAAVESAAVEFMLDSGSVGSGPTDSSGYASVTVQTSLTTGSHSWYAVASRSGYRTVTSTTWSFTYQPIGGQTGTPDINVSVSPIPDTVCSQNTSAGTQTSTCMLKFAYIVGDPIRFKVVLTNSGSTKATFPVLQIYANTSDANQLVYQNSFPSNPLLPFLGSRSLQPGETGDYTFDMRPNHGNSIIMMTIQMSYQDDAGNKYSSSDTYIPQSSVYGRSIPLYVYAKTAVIVSNSVDPDFATFLEEWYGATGYNVERSHASDFYCPWYWPFCTPKKVADYNIIMYGDPYDPNDGYYRRLFGDLVGRLGIREAVTIASATAQNRFGISLGDGVYVSDAPSVLTFRNPQNRNNFVQFAISLSGDLLSQFEKKIIQRENKLLEAAITGDTYGLLPQAHLIDQDASLLVSLIPGYPCISLANDFNYQSSDSSKVLDATFCAFDIITVATVVGKLATVTLKVVGVTAAKEVTREVITSEGRRLLTESVSKSVALGLREETLTTILNGGFDLQKIIQRIEKFENLPGISERIIVMNKNPVSTEIDGFARELQAVEDIRARFGNRVSELRFGPQPIDIQFTLDGKTKVAVQVGNKNFGQLEDFVDQARGVDSSIDAFLASNFGSTLTENDISVLKNKFGYIDVFQLQEDFLR